MQLLTKFAGRQNQAYCSIIKHCYRVTEGTNLWPVKIVRRDERFLLLALVNFA